MNTLDTVEGKARTNRFFLLLVTCRNLFSGIACPLGQSMVSQERRTKMGTEWKKWTLHTQIISENEKSQVILPLELPFLLRKRLTGSLRVTAPPAPLALVDRVHFKFFFSLLPIDMYVSPPVQWTPDQS